MCRNKCCACQVPAGRYYFTGVSNVRYYWNELQEPIEKNLEVDVPWQDLGEWNSRRGAITAVRTEATSFALCLASSKFSPDI